MKKIAMITLISLLSACSMLPQKSVSGIYKGTLPCADCAKIEAELVLNSDHTYQYNTVYYKNKDRHPFVEKGTYVWDKDKPNVLRLTNSGNLALHFSENEVELCDPNGNRVKSNNNYKLKKVVE